MNEANQEMITIEAKQLNELKDRLEDVEEHRRGLLVHTQNLEHLVNEATKHARNLEDTLQKSMNHITNLEQSLKEKESDLEQTKKVMEELKARCYRYEQMLRDHGEKLGGAD